MEGTHFPVLSTDKLLIGGKPLSGGSTIPKVSLLTGDSLKDPETVGKRVNELITALKAAGIMESK